MNLETKEPEKAQNGEAFDLTMKAAKAFFDVIENHIESGATLQFTYVEKGGKTKFTSSFIHYKKENS